MLCCFGFRAACIVQMITDLVPCKIIERACVTGLAPVYLFGELLALLFGFLPCVLYMYLFVLRPSAFTVDGTL